MAGGPRLPEAPGDAWSFLLGGHLYGDPAGQDALAATLAEASARLAAGGDDFLFTAGDTFRASAEPWFSATLAGLAALRMPVFNAPGNHDVANRAEYERRFGPAWGAFVHRGCLFVQVDTEAPPWEIGGEQLAGLRATLRLAAERDDVRAVFCVGHKLVFSHRRRYFSLLLGANAHDGLVGPNRFVADVLPHLAVVARKKPVFWCAGDIGIGRSLPLFVDHDETSGVTFVAVGLGGRPQDLLVRVRLAGGRVDLEPVGLGSEAPAPLADYGLAAWNARFGTATLPPAVAAYRDQFPD